MIVENDRTRDIARPAVIVASIRSGGTFLAHCLSNHSQIFCDRGEPLHNASVWIETLRLDRRRLLAALLNQTGYQVSMCKLTYNQAFKPDVWAWLRQARPMIIWLRRENAIRQALSAFVNKQARKGRLKRPQHTFEETVPLSVAVSATYLIKTARGLMLQDKRAAALLSGWPGLLPMTYEEITEVRRPEYSARGIAPDAGKRICQFLGVRYEEMGSDLMRVNPGRLSEMISNWPIVRKAILASEFAGMIDE